MPKGLVRYRQSGCIHFVTFGCYRRFQHLGTAAARELFERSLEAMAHPLSRRGRVGGPDP